MERVVTNNIKFRKFANGFGSFPKNSELLYNEHNIKGNLLSGFKAKILAFTIFLYYFIENGTLGLFPEKYYMVYRNVRISDLILYALIGYSFLKYREYSYLFKSKSLLVTKIVLAYLLFEFAVSAIRYDFNIIEYFFRLKGIWSSFLVFPFLLLYKRNGLPFLIKIIFPVAIISNILYILTAVTGIPFLPDVAIYSQTLPGGIVVFRVYGGTFYGELFYLGFVYFWITKKFRLWQLPLVVFFFIPHLLAFGRMAWISFAFTIVLFISIYYMKKRNFKIFFKQAVILIIMFAALVIGFIKFIPDSERFVEAIQVRIFQGEDDVKYEEGTYGTRILFQNNALVRLWLNSDKILGIGMHPMWVTKPESHEEQVYYNAFCDVGWPAVLAAYGVIGFLLALIFQVYYVVTSFRIIRKSSENNLQSFLLAVILAKFLFDTLISFSFAFFSIGLWGLIGSLNFYVAVIVFNYEKEKTETA